MKLLDDLFIYIWRGKENNSNTYLLGGKVKILIDPGHAQFFPLLLEYLKKDGFQKSDIDLVINTHAHPDHFEGNSLLEGGDTLFAFHREEENCWKSLGPDFFSTMGLELPEFKADFYLQEGDLYLGEKKIAVIHTPGHSPGGICLYWKDKEVLITGDTVFLQGIGVYEVPGGNGKKLKNSIERLSSLECEYFLPGHGEIIKGKELVAKNFSWIKKFYFPLL